MSTFTTSTKIPVVMVSDRKELHVPLRIYSGFTKHTLERLHEILGHPVVLSLDSKVLRRAQYIDDIYFVLIAKNATDDCLFEASKLILCTIPHFPADEQFGVMRQQIMDNVVPDELSVNIDQVKLWFLGLHMGTFLRNKTKLVMGSLKQARVLARIVSVDLVTRLPNSIFPEMLNSFSKPLSDHRRILASNKPMVAYVKMLLDLLMKGSDESISHQLYGVILMMLSEIWSMESRESIKLAKRSVKCHCFSMMIATPMIHTLSYARHQGKLQYNHVIYYAYCCAPKETFDLIRHPHFCAQCGIFESESTKLKTCSKCKDHKLPSRFLLCSFQCQIASWPYHKWLHRMPKIKI